jgi:hypothetical protein
MLGNQMFDTYHVIFLRHELIKKTIYWYKVKRWKKPDMYYPDNWQTWHVLPRQLTNLTCTTQTTDKPDMYYPDNWQTWHVLPDNWQTWHVLPRQLTNLTCTTQTTDKPDMYYPDNWQTWHVLPRVNVLFQYGWHIMYGCWEIIITKNKINWISLA